MAQPIKFVALKIIHRFPQAVAKLSKLPTSSLVGNVPKPYRLATFFFLVKDYKKTKEVINHLELFSTRENNFLKETHNFVLFRISLGLLILGEVDADFIFEKFKGLKLPTSRLKQIVEALFLHFKHGVISFKGNEADLVAVNRVIKHFFTPDRVWAEVELHRVINLLESGSEYFYDALFEERFFSFHDPKVYGKEERGPERHFPLPKFGMYEIKNAEIRESNAVFKDKFFLLYDLGGHPRNGRSAGSSYYFWKATPGGEIGFGVYPITSKKKFIDKAIVISGRSSHNYYHWIVEYLPKMMLFKNFEEKLKGATIVVDYQMPQQHFAALQVVMNFLRIECPVYRRKAHEQIEVKKLFLPTNPTVISEEFGDWWKASAVSAEHLSFVRTAVLNRYRLAERVTTNRKIIISRPNIGARSIVNLPEIENLLVSHGFERVFPEKMTFEEQVRLFHSADVIFSPGGAALANLLFCHENAKIFAMVSERNADYAGHKNVATIAKADYVHVTGKNTLPRSAFPDEELFVHSSFSVPLEKIKSVLNSLQ